MFQFAAAYRLSKLLNVPLRINIDNYDKNIRKYELDKFPLIKKKYKPIISGEFFHWKIFRSFKFFRKKNNFYESHPFVYNQNFTSLHKNTNLYGYFQSELYFRDIRADILKVFNFSRINDINYLSIKNDIMNNNSVSIHVRRGDLISNKYANTYHGTMPLAYYKTAIKLVRLHVKKPKFFLFSDDLIWVRKNFHFLKDFQLVDINQGSLAFRDIQLMSLCKHNIIANSSFSWWGAWLNKNPRKIVIAPQKWVRASSEPLSDIIPLSWHAI